MCVCTRLKYHFRFIHFEEICLNICIVMLLISPSVFEGREIVRERVMLVWGRIMIRFMFGKIYWI